jgi:hypothetical protein
VASWPGCSLRVSLEQLYWDVFNYSMTRLRVESLEKIASTLESFAQRMKEIAVTSGGSTATAS